MKILLHGASGRMGQVISRLVSSTNDMEITCGVDRNKTFDCAYPIYLSFEDVKLNVDLVIDFSNHTCISDILEFGTLKNIPLVICTTGFTTEEKQKIAAAAKHIPILNSANMSIGVNLILSLVKKAATALNDGFDIEIIEKHHNQKLDSPSGTALAIADAINTSLDDSMEYTYGRHTKTEKRGKNEIGIHAIRGGSIIGEHDVIFAGLGEVIEISHSALSRDVFGYGAIKAAKFILGKKPGLYSMKDVIEE